MCKAQTKNNAGCVLCCFGAMQKKNIYIYKVVVLVDLWLKSIFHCNFLRLIRYIRYITKKYSSVEKCDT